MIRGRLSCEIRPVGDLVLLCQVVINSPKSRTITLDRTFLNQICQFVLLLFNLSLVTDDRQIDAHKTFVESITRLKTSGPSWDVTVIISASAMPDCAVIGTDIVTTSDLPVWLSNMVEVGLISTGQPFDELTVSVKVSGELTCIGQHMAVSDGAAG